MSNEDFLYFKSLGYNQEECAELMCIPLRTLQRHLKSHFLRDCDLKTDLSDDCLDDHLRVIVAENPLWGTILVRAHLMNSRINVSIYFNLVP